MRHDLNAVLIFAEVARRGSFAAAGRALDVPKATVSRKIAELEERLGQRLLNRTTRALSLTDPGRRYLDHAARIADELAAAEADAASLAAAPGGLVRVTASVLLARAFVGPAIAAYVAAQPQVRVTLHVTNQPVDLVEDGLDMAVRIGPVRAASMTLRRLGRGSAGLYAAPAYLAAVGAPDHPAALGRHRLIEDRLPDARPHDWEMQGPGGAAHRIAVSAHLLANEPDVALGWALGGLGIARLPDLVARPHAEGGGLVRVLPDWQCPAVDVSLLFPARRGTSPAVRGLANLLVDRWRRVHRAGPAAGGPDGPSTARGQTPSAAAKAVR